MRRLLQEISEELCQAIGESSELSKKLHDLEQEGYLLNLILDCRQADTDESPVDEPSLGRQRIRTEDSSVAPTPSSTEANPVSEHLAAAEFRIDAQDLAFLRSVGIDPTRPGRSKRRRRAETTSSANGS